MNALQQTDKLLLGVIMVLWLGIFAIVENVQLNTRTAVSTAAVSSSPTLVAGYDAQMIGSGLFAFVNK
jgi:hypothetical protein